MNKTVLQSQLTLKLIMKNTSIVQISAFVLFSIVFPSCESHEKKADRYVQSKYRIQIEKKSKSTKFVKPIVKIEKPVLKTESPNEWHKFKQETESKIIANENKIKELKLLPKPTSKTVRQLENLEKTNNNLRRQLAIFNAEVIAKWENFKTSMNYNVNRVSIELEEISSNEHVVKTQ